MLLRTDQTLACLLLLGAAAHTAGALRAYAGQPATLLWSLCATLALVLIAALNLLRAARSGDRALAWVAVGGTLSWLLVAVAFGVLIHDLLDVRVVLFALICGGLIGLGLRDALRVHPARWARPL